MRTTRHAVAHRMAPASASRHPQCPRASQRHPAAPDDRSRGVRPTARRHGCRHSVDHRWSGTAGAARSNPARSLCPGHLDQQPQPGQLCSQFEVNEWFRQRRSEECAVTQIEGHAGGADGTSMSMPIRLQNRRRQRRTVAALASALNSSTALFASRRRAGELSASRREGRQPIKWCGQQSPVRDQPVIAPNRSPVCGTNAPQISSARRRSQSCRSLASRSVLR